MEALPAAASAPSCRILLLGGLRVEMPDGSILARFRAQKAASLLAYLVYHPNRTFPRDELIELLWPEVEPDTGRKRFKQELASLRRQVEPPPLTPGSVLVTVGRTGVGINREGVVIDVAEFEAALRAARHAGDDVTERARHLSHAVDLYGGPLLHGIDDLWIEGERLRLADAYLDALRRVAGALLEAGDLSSALQYAHRAVQADSYDEDARADLMRVYAARGEPGAIRRQFRELARLLRADDLEPSESLHALAKQLRRQAAAEAVRRRSERGASSLPGSGRALSTAPDRDRPGTAAVPVRLPRPLTRFFGREDEGTHVARILGDEATRLVTLTGLGGSGKTRLAIEVAGRIAPRFPGGVFFVPLTDLSDARLVPGAIADVLGLPRGADEPPLEQVAGALSGAPPTLLVLDNLEQIVDEGAALVGELLARAATLTCLITSRQRLDLMGEQEFPLPPLPTPDPRVADTPERLMENAAVRLFLDRARSIRPDFPLSERNAGAVAALCRRLEGIPLAIELAAAWAQTLSAAQMLAQLSHPFDFLVSRRKDLPPRHRTLRQTLAVSYGLLPEELRRFFTRLSVFRGGWDLAAAQAVCDAPSALDLLARLQSHSLVLAGEDDDVMRYRLLETVREFAEEQLSDGDAALLRQRHTQHYLALAEQAEPELQGPQQVAWLNRLEAEHDNYRAALKGTGDSDREEDGLTCLRLAVALHRFWLVHGHISEGRRWLEKALAGASGRSGSLEAAFHAKSLNAAGSCALAQGDHDAARTLFMDSLALYRRLSDRPWIAACLNNLANIETDQQNFAEARRQYEQSLSILEELDDPAKVCIVQGNLGVVAIYENDLSAAQTFLEKSAASARQLGDTQGESFALHNLAEIARRKGDFAETRRLYFEELALLQTLNDLTGIAYLLVSLGQLALEERSYEKAQFLFGAATAAFDASGSDWPEPWRGLIEQGSSQARSLLGQAHADAAWRQGRNMTLKELPQRV